MATPRSDTPRDLADARSALSSAIATALNRDEAVSHALHSLVIDSGRAANTIELFKLLERTAEAIREVIELGLPDINSNNDRLSGIRAFFLTPKDSYSITELTALWQADLDTVRRIFDDELAHWEQPHPDDREPLQITWPDAVATACLFNFFRPFDIENALAGSFSIARTARWRTVPILIRLPTFVLAKLAEVSALPDGTAHAVVIEQSILEQFHQDYRQLFEENCAGTYRKQQ